MGELEPHIVHKDSNLIIMTLEFEVGIKQAYNYNLLGTLSVRNFVNIKEHNNNISQ